MKFCEKCGNQLLDDAIICNKCGCAVHEKPYANGVQGNEVIRTVLAIVCFFIAFMCIGGLFGFIIYSITII